MLEEIAQSVRRAKESISLAGSLAHSDPDDAWNVSLEASDHCSEALADLARIDGARNGERHGAGDLLTSVQTHDAAAVYRLIALLNRGAHTKDGATHSNSDTRLGGIEGRALSQTDIINHVADLCKEAVEEGMIAHSLAATTEVRDAAWISVMASVEALYALLLIGADLPSDLNFAEGELDLAALHLVDEINVRVSNRIKRDHGEAGANLRR